MRKKIEINTDEHKTEIMSVAKNMGKGAKR